MNWIPVEEIEKYDPHDSIAVWQENLSDPECSRFQRAVFYGSHFQIYPLTNGKRYHKDKDYKGYDLEGDMCQITHFALVEAPAKK